jgi:hypothetical protein
MFDQSMMSSVSSWFLDCLEPRATRTRLRAGILSRNPISRTPAAIAKMWVIGGPQGMSLECAKRDLGIRPGPRDLVIYSQHKVKGSGAPQPHLISCQPYTH